MPRSSYVSAVSPPPACGMWSSTRRHREDPSSTTSLEVKSNWSTEALTWAADYAADWTTKYLDTARTPSPAGLFAHLADQWRREYARRALIVAVRSWPPPPKPQPKMARSPRPAGRFRPLAQGRCGRAHHDGDRPDTQSPDGNVDVEHAGRRHHGGPAATLDPTLAGRRRRAFAVAGRSGDTHGALPAAR